MTHAVRIPITVFVNITRRSKSCYKVCILGRAVLVADVGEIAITIVPAENEKVREEFIELLSRLKKNVPRQRHRPLQDIPNLPKIGPNKTPAAENRALNCGSKM